MSISSYLKLSQFLTLLIVSLVLSSCGGDFFGSDDQATQTPIPTEAIPSDSFDDATVVVGTDSNGVEVKIVVESSYAGDIVITEGLDPGLPDTYQFITNGFIEISLSPDAQGKQIVRVTSPAAFEVVLVRDEANLEMSYTPFHSKDDGSIEFYVAPIDGSIIFALMDVPES